MEGHKIVKAMRIYLGMTQADAADKVGITLKAYQRYENIDGYLMKGNFSIVCKIIEVVHLNPRKFFMERYELSQLGYQVTSRGTTGAPSHIQKKMVRENCPVRYVGRSNRKTKV